MDLKTDYIESHTYDLKNALIESREHLNNIPKGFIEDKNIIKIVNN